MHRRFAAVSLLFAAGVCCSGPSTAPMNANNTPPPGDETPEPPAIARAEIGPALGLSELHVAAIRNYEGALAAASESTDALCRAVVGSAELTVLLQDVLLARRDELFESPSYESFGTAVDKLSNDLPGVFFAVGAEGLYANPTYEGLGDPTGPSAAFLEAVRGLIGESYPVWIEQTWDLGGCAIPARAISPLAALAEAYEAAPPCLQSAVAPRPTESIQAMSEATCFCDKAQDVRQAAESLIPILSRLRALGGKDAARKLDESSQSKTAQYESSCAG